MPEMAKPLPGAVTRRRDRRVGTLAPVLVFWIVLVLSTPLPGRAQVSGPAEPPGRIGSIPLVLGEHGDPTLVVPLSATVLGLAVFDIASAPGSARRFNQGRVAGLRSPTTAFALSLGSTAVPVAAGALAFLTGAERTGVMLAFTGIVVGPSVGHVYAGRVARGVATAGLRIGLATLAGLTLLQAS